jgi:hypothetical protein
VTLRPGGALLVVFLALGCIKVPERVKLNFCAQPGEKNHFGSGAAAKSCCPHPPRAPRFGAEERACRR